MDTLRRPSLMDHFLNMLRLSNNPTVPAGQEEAPSDVDEPPEDVVPELGTPFPKDPLYSRANTTPQMSRRESLLTRAIRAGSDSSPNSPSFPRIPRGLSTTSSHSFASTVDLTSDGDSPARSASPSPPPPTHRLQLPSVKPSELPVSVTVLPITKDDKILTTEVGEAAVEKTLGRKRCIMFACAGTEKEPTKDTKPEQPKQSKVDEKAEPPKRKCALTFVCPSRQDSQPGIVGGIKKGNDAVTAAKPTTPEMKSSKQQNPSEKLVEKEEPKSVTKTQPITAKQETSPPSSRAPAFHEFAGSHVQDFDWERKADEANIPKLTMEVCLKKENAIRQLGKEAEEEAEAEERELEDLEEELDEDDAEDDFAPSDDGNESDDENGFADSDSESDVESEYRFWAPSTTTAATSTDNLTHISSRQRSRSRASSTSSAMTDSISHRQGRPILKPKSTKHAKMLPGTPELPDSTDFVCGTLDEDRPLEAAFISCREQKRQAKHIPIPQDIDPSFPTSDPEDEEDEDEVDESSDVFWHKNTHFEDFDDDHRGRHSSTARLISPINHPAPDIAPPRNLPAVRPRPVARTSKSPAPPKRQAARSPPPKRQTHRSPPPARLLFGEGLRQFRPSQHASRLRSPRGSPTNTNLPVLGITINRLAQRPNADTTSSLPHTPNPFFRNWQRGSPATSRIASAAITPKQEEPRLDLHVRGPVDIVIGLEKKRQKRKDKFWRQHCRKAAKEQAEKRPPPGRGAERMKELGLECAERNRGYGLGQQAQLVLSL